MQSYLYSQGYLSTKLTWVWANSQLYSQGYLPTKIQDTRCKRGKLKLVGSD